MTEEDGLQALWYPAKEAGLAQRAALAPLWALSAPLYAGVAVKNALYDRRVLRPAKVEGAKVISVGNLNVGGAGKTPVTLFLAQRLLARGQKVAVLTRGYGRLSNEPLGFDASAPAPVTQAGDEPSLIARRAEGAKVYVGADRVAQARRAVSEGGAQVLLLDDGMQHRRLARDVDILVVDEACGFGNGALLPKGPLREPPSSARRASLVWLRAAKKKHPRLPAFGQKVVRARHFPKTVFDPEGEAHPAKSLAKKKVVALCALARPRAFLDTLTSLGAEVVGACLREDHHYWEVEEVAKAEREARRKGALLVTTEKDQVKLPPLSEAWVLRIEVEILSGEAHLDAALFGGEK